MIQSNDLDMDHLSFQQARIDRFIADKRVLELSALIENLTKEILRLREELLQIKEVKSK
jgi:hypothetical protein